MSPIPCNKKLSHEFQIIELASIVKKQMLLPFSFHVQYAQEVNVEIIFFKFTIAKI